MHKFIILVVTLTSLGFSGEVSSKPVALGCLGYSGPRSQILEYTLVGDLFRDEENQDLIKEWGEENREEKRMHFFFSGFSISKRITKQGKRDWGIKVFVYNNTDLPCFCIKLELAHSRGHKEIFDIPILYPIKPGQSGELIIGVNSDSFSVGMDYFARGNVEFRSQKLYGREYKKLIAVDFVQ